MDPVTISAVLALVDWKKVFKGLTTEGASKAAKSLLERIKPDEREKIAKRAIELFVEEFLIELEDKTPLSAAIPGYHDQLSRLIEHAAPDITASVQPETKDVDLAPVERMWSGLKLDPLPEDFDWALLAKNYARDSRKLVKGDPTLREQLNTALLEQQTELQQRSTDALVRMAGLDPGFDLLGYREYLHKKCALLQLSAMHTSTYDRRVKLWSVFVAQSARESVPVRDLPRDLLRRLRQEGQIKEETDDAETARLRESYQSSPVSSVLDVLTRNRRVVVLGDPGSGKTSLLKFLVMRWVTQEPGAIAPLPIWIDLKEYAEERSGFLKYCDSGCTTYGLSSRRLEQALKNGGAALYLDGLDEVFDGPVRGLIVDEIAASAARYPEAVVIVTSRIVGYEPDQLGSAGFTHATLEDFDDPQVFEFLGKWHDAATDDTRERSRLLGQLERALRDSRAVRDLAGNPLLLTMMAILNRNQELPRDRVELYAQASRVLLHEWDASRSLPVDRFARQEKEEILRELAGTMQQGDGSLAGNLIERTRLVDLFRAFLKSLDVPDPHGTATSLVRQLTERNFILCFAGADRFSFVHRTFLEYFCASWFANLFQKKQTLSLEQLKNEVFGRRWRDEAWHEVLRLIAGMVGESQAEELILFLAAQDGRGDKLANLMLAAGCLSEVRNRSAIQTTDETLRQRFMEEVIRYGDFQYPGDRVASPEPRSTRTKAVRLIAFVWRSERTRVWLRSAAESDVDWIVREAAVRELARSWKDDREMLTWLKERACLDKDNDVRAAAAKELAEGWKDDPEILVWLQERIYSEEHPLARMTMVAEVARGWKNSHKTLVWLKERAHSDKNLDVQMAAVEEIARGWRDDPETLSFLKECVALEHDEGVRSTAVQELARGWKDDPDIKRLLMELARSDQHNGVRVAAVVELARRCARNPETLPFLKDSLRSDPDGYVRSAAVGELARGWKNDPETLPILKDRIRSDDSSAVRLTVVQELARGWKGDPGTLPMLKDRARADQNYTVRVLAFRLLARGWKDDPDTLPILKDRAQSDEHKFPRRAAREELARGWKDDVEVIALLKSAKQSGY